MEKHRHGEGDLERALRPRRLDEFIGQQKIKDNLRVFIQAALQREETLDHVLLSGPPGLGKCITADSLILTDNGWVPFGEILPNDMAPGESQPLEVRVYGVHGFENTSHVYASGHGPTCRLRTRAGFTLEGTPQHPVLVASHRGPRWKQLGELTKGDFVAISCGTGTWSPQQKDELTRGDTMVATPVLESPHHIVVEHLKTLLCADQRPEDAVQISLTCVAVAQQAQLHLAGIGIISYRPLPATLVIAAEDVAYLQGEIPFPLHRNDKIPYATELLRALSLPSHDTSQSAVWQQLAALPPDREEARALHALASNGIYWDPVAEMHSSEAETFDFVVPGTHSFVANGFFNHNTTLGHIIAEEMKANIVTTSGPVLDKPASIAGILTNLKEGDVLFIDEIHRLSPVVEEYLYSAMEDYHIDIVIDSGPNARSVMISLPPFTLVGATTRKGLLTAPLRARFGIDFRYDYYTAELLEKIILRSAGILNLQIARDGAAEIARRSRGTPRIANRLLRRARDFAEIKGNGTVTRATADRALQALDVDQAGLDDMDTRILITLIQKFNGNAVGLSNLAISVGEDAGTIEEVYEPYLIQEGYLQRTPRGRIATPRAYAHFGLQKPQTSDLFTEK